MKKLFRISTVPISLNLLLKGQLKFLNQYYKVTAISGQGKDLKQVEKREGVKVHSIEIHRPISVIQDFKSLIQLYQYFRKEKPQIIHSITPKAGLLSMIAGKLAGVPIRMHTFTGLIFPNKEGLLQRTLILMDRILCFCATHIYPEGNGVKNDLIEHKITKKPLKILGNGNVNGINVDYFSKKHFLDSQNQEFRTKYNIAPEDFVFIFVGRLVKDKGINELVLAFNNLCHQFFNSSTLPIKLLLIGPHEKHLDPLEKSTEEIISTNPNIIETGYQEDVRPYFAISDALVFPSYREGFPNVVLQAGAMELPSIVSNINGCNEIIEDGKNGVIIPAKNVVALEKAMQKFLENKMLYQNLKQNSRQNILNKYEQHHVWQALKNEYDFLLNSQQK